ncbi:MAG: fibronectin type III domain-containing protein [Planctomycetota bacterium]|nr:MAG: fibronectin type III domain-containing protein [Planctomycetota bacterium]
MDPKQLALAHFEKGILAIFVGWLAVVGAGFVMKPAELQKNDQLTRQMRQINSYMNSARPPEVELPDLLPRLRRQLDPAEVPSVARFPDWAMHRRPQLIYSVADSGPKHTPVHKAPEELSFDSEERGKIVLSWKPSVDNAYVMIVKYEIERREGEDGEWEVVGSVDGLEESYEDTTVQSRKKYYYRVVSVAEIERDNAVVDAEGLELPEEDERKVSRVVGPVETQRDVYIVPITVQQITDEDRIRGAKGPESAYVRVYKWDSEEGKFLSHAFNVKVGQRIGKKIKKRRRELDFNTGAVLKDVEIRQRRHKLGHNEPVQWIQFQWPDGSVEESTDKDIPEELKGR